MVKEFPTEIDQTNESDESNIEEESKAKDIINEFLKSHEKDLIQMAIQYTMENGLGALFCTLIPGSDELDIEFFRVDDLDGNFKKKILDNPNNKSTIYYAIRLYKTSYIFERDIGP